MLIFRGGDWIDVALPVADPALTLAHQQRFAAAVATAAVKGVSVERAVQEAEKEMYAEVFATSSVLRK